MDQENDTIYLFNTVTILCLSKVRPCISNLMSRGLRFMFIDFFEVSRHSFFVDIGGIVYYHCLDFLLISPSSCVWSGPNVSFTFLIFVTRPLIQQNKWKKPYRWPINSLLSINMTDLELLVNQDRNNIYAYSLSLDIRYIWSRCRTDDKTTHFSMFISLSHITKSRNF